MSDWVSILPPLAAIILALWKREVILSLLFAIWISESLLQAFNPAIGILQTLERITTVFNSPDNTRIILFSLLIGTLIAYIQNSGGVNAFVHWVSRKGLSNSPRKVGLLTTGIGIIVFIESNMSILTAGILSRNLFDKFNLSRARLAYIIDSTCAPICTLILLNAWGAFLLGLMQPYALQNPVKTIISSIPLNFYSIITLLLVFYTVISNRVHGTLRKQESKQQPQQSTQSDISPTKIRYMLLPITIMISGMLFFMWYTGNGKMLEGSGSKSVLWSVSFAILSAYLLMHFGQKESHKTLIQTGFNGMSKLLVLVTTVILAIALGMSLKELGTGEYIAKLISGTLPLWLIAPITFISASLVSFTTGTSWGTFALVVPIAIPIALVLGLPPALILAAAIGGGVFGDHCSPISDTTIISSLASGCDHFEHVSTQLPYALTAGGLTVIAYSIAGYIL